METYLSTRSKLLCLSILFFSLCCFNARTVSSGGIPPVRAVNLGGWLVTEGWMKPSLFDGITNKDFLDGTGLQLKSVTVGKFLCAESGGGANIVANRPSASGWETFRLWRINATYFNFRVFNNQFVGLDTSGNGVNVVSVVNQIPGATETFEIQISPYDPHRVRIRAPNGSFLQAKTEELVTADYQENGGWGDDNPSVFLLTFSGKLQGEFQVTNGYGTRASQVMNEHWSTFIVEEDFNFIKNNGLNAVRIPVGWWTAYGSSPPRPYVAGSLQALDNAFRWAEKYEIKVILDLHAAPGSQNGNDHSSSRDGSQDWGRTDDSIHQTVNAISFLTARYAGSPSLFAVELINEPLSPGVSLETLTRYYQLGYNAVRQHSQTAYVVLSNRLGPMQPRELFPLASGFSKSVVDVHYYNLYSDMFTNFNVEQNLQYVHNDRSGQINEMTTSNGPLILVGEWVAEWMVRDASKEDYQKYASAQLEVFGRATFGWAYWSLKNVNNAWSLEWMIKNGYITL